MPQIRNNKNPIQKIDQKKCQSKTVEPPEQKPEEFFMEPVFPKTLQFSLCTNQIQWYNSRIHGALNLEIGETPQEAFIRKLRSESLFGLFWKRIERWSL